MYSKLFEKLVFEKWAVTYGVRKRNSRMHMWMRHTLRNYDSTNLKPTQMDLGPMGTQDSPSPLHKPIRLRILIPLKVFIFFPIWDKQKTLKTIFSHLHSSYNNCFNFVIISYRWCYDIFSYFLFLEIKIKETHEKL